MKGWETLSPNWGAMAPKCRQILPELYYIHVLLKRVSQVGNFRQVRVPPNFLIL